MLDVLFSNVSSGVNDINVASLNTNIGALEYEQQQLVREHLFEGDALRTPVNAISHDSLGVVYSFSNSLSESDPREKKVIVYVQPDGSFWVNDDTRDVRAASRLPESNDVDYGAFNGRAYKFNVNFRVPDFMDGMSSVEREQRLGLNPSIFGPGGVTKFSAQNVFGNALDEYLQANRPTEPEISLDGLSVLNEAMTLVRHAKFNPKGLDSAFIDTNDTADNIMKDVATIADKLTDDELIELLAHLRAFNVDLEATITRGSDFFHPLISERNINMRDVDARQQYITRDDLSRARNKDFKDGCVSFRNHALSMSFGKGSVFAFLEPQTNDVAACYDKAGATRSLDGTVSVNNLMSFAEEVAFTLGYDDPSEQILFAYILTNKLDQRRADAKIAQLYMESMLFQQEIIRGNGSIERSPNPGGYQAFYADARKAYHLVNLFNLKYGDVGAQIDLPENFEELIQTDAGKKQAVEMMKRHFTSINVAETRRLTDEILRLDSTELFSKEQRSHDAAMSHVLFKIFYDKRTKSVDIEDMSEFLSFVNANADIGRVKIIKHALDVTMTQGETALTLGEGAPEAYDYIGSTNFLSDTGSLQSGNVTQGQQTNVAWVARNSLKKLLEQMQAGGASLQGVPENQQDYNRWMEKVAFLIESYDNLIYYEQSPDSTGQQPAMA